MAWQNPFSAVTGSIIQASDWNTSGRDNLLYLKSSAITLNAGSATVPNSVLTAFDIGSPAVACTYVEVFRNGLQKAAGGVDYTFTSGENHVHFVSAPLTGDVVRFNYIPA